MTALVVLLSVREQLLPGLRLLGRGPILRCSEQLITRATPLSIAPFERLIFLL